MSVLALVLVLGVLTLTPPSPSALEGRPAPNPAAILSHSWQTSVVCVRCLQTMNTMLGKTLAGIRSTSAQRVKHTRHTEFTTVPCDISPTRSLSSSLRKNSNHCRKQSPHTMPRQGAAPRHTTAHLTRTAVPIRRNVSFTLKTIRNTVVPARVPVSLVHAQRSRQCVNSNSKCTNVLIHAKHNVHDEQQRSSTRTGPNSLAQRSTQSSRSFSGQGRNLLPHVRRSTASTPSAESR